MGHRHIRVYGVTAVITTGAGGEQALPVSSLVLSSEVNAVPTLQLRLGSFTSAKARTQVTTSLVPFFEDYASLRQQIEKDTCRVTVTLRLGEMERDPYVLTLAEWVVVDVAMAEVSVAPGASPGFTLRAAHPLYYATSGTGWLPNVATMPLPDTENISGADVMQMCLNTMRALYTKLVTAPLVTTGAASSSIRCGNLDAIRAAVGKRAVAAYDVMTKYLVFEAGKGEAFPFGAGVNAGLIQWAWQEFFRSGNLWQTMAQGLLPSLELIVSAGFRKPELRVRPLCPWGAITNWYSSVGSLTLSGGRDYVVGVVVQEKGAKDDGEPLSTMDSEADGESVDAATVVTALTGDVCAMMGPDAMPGVAALAPPPPWIDMMEQQSFAALDPEVLNTAHGAPVLQGASTAKTPETGSLESLTRLERYAKWATQSVRKTIGAAKTLDNLQAALLLFPELLNDPNARTEPIPGEVIAVQAHEPNSERAGLRTLLAFFVTRVVHTVDVENGQAGTTLYGSHVRLNTIPAIELTDFDSGLSNPVYDKIAKA